MVSVFATTLRDAVGRVKVARTEAIRAGASEVRFLTLPPRDAGGESRIEDGGGSDGVESQCGAFLPTASRDIDTNTLVQQNSRA